MAESPSPPERKPDESPFAEPEATTGYPLPKDEQERVDRLVEEHERREKSEQ